MLVSNDFIYVFWAGNAPWIIRRPFSCALRSDSVDHSRLSVIFQPLVPMLGAGGCLEKKFCVRLSFFGGKNS